MFNIADRTVEHVSAALSEIINKHHGLQLHDVSMHAPNRSMSNDFRFTVRVLSCLNFSKFLHVKHIREHGVYCFEFDVDIDFAQSRCPLVDQVIAVAVQNVAKPLLEALDEFNFDNEVTNLLATESITTDNGHKQPICY